MLRPHQPAEFHAGAGARRRASACARSSPVGDPKQSIYFVPGGGPAPLRGEPQPIGAKLAPRRAATPFEEVPLVASFPSRRSCCAPSTRCSACRRISAASIRRTRRTGTVHESVRTGRAPGPRTSSGPANGRAPPKSPDAWTHPVDARPGARARRRGRARIAPAVETWTTKRGDALRGACAARATCLILVRKRNAPPFHAVIKAAQGSRHPRRRARPALAHRATSRWRTLIAAGPRKRCSAGTTPHPSPRR